jgi:hypothetical protein
MRNLNTKKTIAKGSVILICNDTVSRIQTLLPIRVTYDLDPAKWCHLQTIPHSRLETNGSTLKVLKNKKIFE